MSRDLPENGMFAAIDGFVLVVHNGTSTRRFVLSEISCESGNGWDDNDDSEFPTGLASSHTCIDDGATDGIKNGGLLVASSRD